MVPTPVPTLAPSFAPTALPSLEPTSSPSGAPTLAPTATPTLDPTPLPTAIPTLLPSSEPSPLPTYYKAKGTTSVFITFESHEAPDYGNPLKLCYFFQNTTGGVEVPKLYNDLTLEVRDVRELTGASPGDIENAVVGMPKIISFGGFGIKYGDKAKWAVGLPGQRETDCEGPMVPQIGSGESTVGHNGEATFTFTEPALANTINSDGRVFIKLCYKHADEPYQHHNYTMELHMIRSYQTFSGDRRTAISGIPERFNFRGFGLSRDDTHYWTSEKCGSRRKPYMSKNVTNRLTHRYLNTSSTFDNAYLGQTMFLCWEFRDEGYHAYPNITIRIGGVRDVTAATGDKDVVVLGAKKTITFNGALLRSGDAIRWVLGHDCTDTTNVYDNHTVFRGRPANNVTATFIFTKSVLAGKNLTLCYRHAIDPQSPYKLYEDIVLVVRSLTGMNATSGSDTKAVAMLEKKFDFKGHGVAQNDRVRFITDASESCEDVSDSSPLAKLYKSNGGDAFTAKLSKKLDVDLTFKTPFYNQLRLCYKFGNEPYYMYGNVTGGFRMSVVGIEDVRSRSGSTDLAVCTVPKKISFHGPGTSTNDKVRWTVGDDCENENDLVVFNQTNNSQYASTANLNYNASFGGITHSTFLFDPAVAGQRPKLCYLFEGEGWKLLSAFRLKLAYLSGNVNVKPGDPGIAVADYAKMWKFAGSFVASGDKAKWVLGKGCDNATALLTPTTDADKKAYSVVASNGYATINISSSNVGKGDFSLCYAFAREPWLQFRGLTVTIRQLGQVQTSYSAYDVIVADMVKDFRFTGAGLAPGDKVRWVNGTSDDACNDGSLKIVEASVDTYGKMESVFEAVEVVVPAKLAGGPFSTCFKFGDEPYKIYTELTLEVVTVSDATTDVGDVEVLVEDDPKVFHFEGAGIASGDSVVWIPLSDATSDEACDADAGFAKLASGSVDEYGNVTVTANPDVVGEYTADKAWALCYTHQSEPPKLYASLTLRLRRLYSVSVIDDGGNATALGTTLTAVVGVEKAFKVVADGLDSSALAKWTSTESTCNDESSPAGGILEPSIVTTDGVMKFTFASPTTSGSTFGLCFKFEGEPWRFYGAIEIEVNQITGVSSNSILKNVPQVVYFLGFGVSTTIGLYGYDKATWVQVGTSCTSAEVAEDAQSVVSGSATFSFEDDAEFLLCYRFAAETSFVEYSNILVEVTDTVIEAENYNAVVESEVSIVLIGSFGINSGDLLQWVANSAPNCSDAVRELYAVGGGEYSPTSTTYGGDATPYLGTALYDFTFASTSEESTPWKLCYQFGGGDFAMYSGVEIAVSQVTAAVMAEGSVLELDTPITFTFDGVWLDDGDSALLVGSDVISDENCESLSVPFQTVVGRETTFTFVEPMSSIALCYYFSLSQTYKYYGGIVSVTSAAEDVSAAEEEVAAQVTLTLDLDFSTIPEGSPAREKFETGFVTDVSSALGIPSYRVTIIDIYSGSIVVVFEIAPSTDSEEAAPEALAQDFVEQAADPTSTLYAGNITSSSTGVTFEIVSLSGGVVTNENATATATSEATSGIAILRYQDNGLFVLTKEIYYTTERSGKVVLPVLRQQGTLSTVKLSWKTTAGTATAGRDFVSASGTLTFLPGVTEQYITIDILDDVSFEAAYETFEVSLSVVPDLLLAGAAIGPIGRATVRIFDYGDGSSLFFNADFLDSSASLNGAAGDWDIVGNGVESGVWVDEYGLAASDRIYGPAEYSQECDLAATEACDHSCMFGGGYAESDPFVGRSPSVLAMNGEGYLATTVSGFPTTEASFVAWVRTTTTEKATSIFSYVTKEGLHEFLLYDPESLSLMIHDQIVEAGTRYDGVEGGDRRGFRTGVSIADGAWHHIAVNWRSADGHVELYVDGIRRFQGSGYKTGKVLADGGTAVLGNMQSAPCVFDQAGVPACTFVQGRGFLGQIQNVRVFDTVLDYVQVLGELKWPVTSSPTQSVIYWRFVVDYFATTSLPAYYAKDLSEHGHDAWISHTGVQVQPGTPSIHPNYPCGEVYKGIWHFRTNLGTDVAGAYGSRLQFAMYSPSSDGNIRDARGTVVLKGNQTSKEISFTSRFDTPSSEGYSYMSAVLSASSSSWLVEPLGTVATAQDMRDVLADSPELLLRGDTHVYGDEGYGKEVVYLKEVSIRGGR